MITTLIISENNTLCSSIIKLEDKKQGTFDVALYDYGGYIKKVVLNYDISDEHIIVSYIKKYNDFDQHMKKCIANRDHIYDKRRQEIEHVDRMILELKYKLNNEFEQHILENITLSETELKIRKELNQLHMMKKKHIDEINLLSKKPISFKYIETKNIQKTKAKMNEWSNPICIHIDNCHYADDIKCYDLIFNYIASIPNNNNRVDDITIKTEVNFIENDIDSDNEFDNLIL